MGIVGPKPVWILGNIHEFRDKDKLSIFKVWRKQFGDIYGYYEGFKPSLVICDPELSRLILVKYFDKFNIRPIYNPFLYYPDECSLLNVNGPEWKTQRTAVVAAFNAIPAHTILTKVCKTANSLSQILCNMADENRNGIDISSIIDRFTLDAFSYGVFDYEVDSMHDEDVILYQFMKVFNESSAADNPIAGLARVYESLTPFLQLFDTKHRDIHIQHIKELRALIESRTEQGLQNVPDNVVDFLLQTTIHTDSVANSDEKQRRKLTIEEVVGHLNSIIGGGFGTTNAALAFVLHQLTVNEDIQDKVFEEIKYHCGLFEEPDVSSLMNLKYLDCVINETLRILPCAPGVARECTEDCTINGVDFKKGMVIRVMVCALYDDDSIYPEAKKFCAERYTESEREKRHPNTFLPYGQGPRMCPGYKLATLLLKVAIVYILRNFILKPCEKTKDPLPTALRPMLVPESGVFVELQLRNNNTSR